MGLVAVDVSPDQIIEWFSSYPETERQRHPVGDCPHACAHRMVKVVAWGPSYEHYELHVCDDPDGCKSDCRGWTAGTGATSYELLRRTKWKLLADAVPA
jgi:hypothetical protein